MRGLELRVDYDREQLDAIPARGRVVVVADHPFGVLDGIVVSYPIAKVHPDFKVLTNSLLCRVAKLQSYLLPIDFAGTPAATTINLHSRAQALSWLCRGGALAVFPGAAVSTFARRAVDPEWKLFIAKAIAHAQATVVPVFFEGQNRGSSRSRATSVRLCACRRCFTRSATRSAAHSRSGSAPRSPTSRSATRPTERPWWSICATRPTSWGRTAGLRRA